MRTKHYRRNLRDMGPVKRLGMHLLSQGAAQSDVVRELGVSRTTAWNWAAALADGGMLGVEPAAPLPSLPATQMAELERLLGKGARSYGFPGDEWTMARMAVVIECEFGLVCGTVHVWKMLGGISASPITFRRRLKNVFPANEPGAKGEQTSS